jgi:hypothetical protein
VWCVLGVGGGCRAWALSAGGRRVRGGCLERGSAANTRDGAGMDGWQRQEAVSGVVRRVVTRENARAGVHAQLTRGDSWTRGVTQCVTRRAMRAATRRRQHEDDVRQDTSFITHRPTQCFITRLKPWRRSLQRYLTEQVGLRPTCSVPSPAPTTTPPGETGIL